MVIGFFMDKITVWKAMFIVHILIVVAIVIFVSYTPTQDAIYSPTDPQPIGMTIGFIGMQIFATI